jgi:hypothetical protein
VAVSTGHNASGYLAKPASGEAPIRYFTALVMELVEGEDLSHRHSP